jgi:hypothetical protein
MNNREQARFDALKRAGTFGTTNAADFTTPVPPAATPSPGQTQAKTLFDSFTTPTTGLIDRIGKNAGSQRRGDRGSARDSRDHGSIPHAARGE